MSATLVDHAWVEWPGPGGSVGFTGGRGVIGWGEINFPEQGQYTGDQGKRCEDVRADPCQHDFLKLVRLARVLAAREMMTARYYFLGLHDCRHFAQAFIGMLLRSPITAGCTVF